MGAWIPWEEICGSEFDVALFGETGETGEAGEAGVVV